MTDYPHPTTLYYWHKRQDLRNNSANPGYGRSSMTMAKKIPGIVLVAIAAVWAAVLISPAGAAAQGITRQIQQSIGKNVRLSVERQMMRLRVDGSAGPVTAMDIAEDGRFLATVSGDGGLRLWDLPMGRQIRLYPAGGPAPTALRFSPDGQVLLAADAGGAVTLWPVGGAEPLRRLPGGGRPATALSLAPDGASIAIGDDEGTIRLFALDGRPIGTPIRAHQGAVRALAIGYTGQFLLSGGADGRVAIREIISGSVVRTVEAGKAAVTAAVFGRDETEFYTGTAEGIVRAWRTDTDTALRDYPGARGAIADMRLSSDGSALLAGDAASQLLLWPQGGGPARAWPAHEQPIRAVRFDIDPKRVVSASEDGLTKVWNAASGVAVATLISTQRGWAVVDEEGRFDGADSALRNVKWVNDTHVLPIENFSERFYEPGLLSKKRLGTNPLITQPALTMRDGILPPPQIRLGTPQGRVGGRREVEVSVTATDQGGGIKTIDLFHNGKIVDPARKAGEKRGEQERRAMLEVTYRVPIVAGQNRFLAVATSDEDLVGMASETTLTAEIEARRPVLHAIIIGINEYEAPRLRLSYAVPDAYGIIKSLKALPDSLFREIRVHQLFDAASTPAGIATLFDAIRDTEPDDVVVIYLAGHGDSDGEQWYFIPSDFPLPYRKENLKTHGVSSGFFRDALSKLDARRVLLLLDTCKSGSLVGGIEDYLDRRSIRRLGSAVGMFVVAATDKDQLASESATIGHGIFTYTVLQALTGAADIEPRDGNVTVGELVSFAEEQVPEFSQKYAKRQQWPLIFARGIDFTVGRPAK